MHSAMFGVFLAVASLASVAKGLSSNVYCPGVSDRVKTCFSNQGLTYRGDNYDRDPPKTLDRAVNMTDMNTVCSKIRSFNQALDCAYSQVQTCLGAVISQSLSSRDNMTHYYGFFCGKKDEIDANCTDAKLQDVESCVVQTFSTEQPKLPRPVTFSQLSCLGVEITYDCAGKVFASCASNTKAVMQEAINKYAVPNICGIMPGRPGRKPFTYGLASASALSRSVAVFVISLLMSLIFHL